MFFCKIGRDAERRATLRLWRVMEFLMSEDASVSLAAARLVDARCDEFEKALVAGSSPVIEAFLEGLSATARQGLLVELIGLEIDIRVARGEQPQVSDYATRFPELGSEQIAKIIQGLLIKQNETPAQEVGQRAVLTPTILSPTDEAVLASHAAAGLRRVRYFGDYELLREIARGGMGVVYEARQRSLNRPVALKMILSGQLASAEEVTRFRREAEAAAQLEHPGIVPIYEIGTDGDQHYFTMGYVPGPSLSARLLERPLEPREAAELIRDVALAMQYAHERGVVHRDLKPSNILLQRVEGRGLRGEGLERRQDSATLNSQPSTLNPKITDFGLAKFSRVDKGLTDKSLTETGQILGTPSYMPPEQAAGLTNEVGPAADIYALGAVLYACLTGRPPFQAASAIDTVRQVLERDPVSLRDLNVSIPQDLETISLKCLEKSIPRRYATAKEVADELQRYLEGRPIEARPVSRGERVWRWCRRNPIVAGLSAAVVVSLVLGTAVSSYFAWKEGQRAIAEADARLEETRQRQEADRQTGIATRLSDENLKLAASEKSAREEAVQELVRARQRLYVGDVQLASIALARGDVAATLRHLENQQPADDSRDLREWEWFYLRSQCFEFESTYRAHDRPIEQVEWNSAGDRFAAVDSAGNVSVWAVDGERPLQQWQTEPPQPLRLSWNHSGQWLAAFPTIVPTTSIKADQQRCFVWNVETGRLVLNEPARDAAWQPQRSTLAAADPQAGVWTWNADSGDVDVTRIESLSQPVTALTWLPNADQLAVAMTDKVEIIRADNGETVSTLSGFTGELGCLSVSPDGQHLCGATRFVGLRPGSGYMLPPETVVAWNLAKAEVIDSWKIDATASRLRWHPAGKLFVVCPGATYAARVTVHQIGSTDPLLTTDGFDASWHRSSPLLAIAERNGVSLWHSGTRPIPKQRTLRGHLGQVYAVHWNPQDETLLSGSGDMTIRRWQAGNSPPQHLPRGASVVSTSSDERFQVIRTSYQATGRLLLINAQTGAVLGDMAQGDTAAVSWSRSGNRVALTTPTVIHPTGKIPGVFTVWETQPARQLWSIPSDSVRVLAWSPDESQMLWTRHQAHAQVQLVGVVDRAVQAEWTLNGPVTGMTWSPSGKTWACVLNVPDPAGGPASSKLEVRGLDGTLIERFAVPESCNGSRCRPQFSPDGRMLAWATFEADSRRGRIFVWNLETREVIVELTGHDEIIQSLAWNQTGTRLASANFLGTKIWDVSSGLTLIDLEKGAGAELRWSQSGKRLFGQVFEWNASRGFDQAEELPTQSFRLLVRPFVGGGFF